MAEILSLSNARKAKARTEKATVAEANRLKFGRTKAEKQHEAAEIQYAGGIAAPGTGGRLYGGDDNMPVVAPQAHIHHRTVGQRRVDQRRQLLSRRPCFRNGHRHPRRVRTYSPDT